jgi:hypothetical protein
MSILNAFDNYLVGFRRMRTIARTERLIRSLPPEVQKDIGWPGPYEENRRRIVHGNPGRCL